MANPRVLFAEDDAVLRDVYKRKFTAEGFDVVTAKDGVEAIAEIEKQAPAILLLDVNMPEVDGFGVLERFPKDKRNFPIVILTNYDQFALSDKGQKLGADGYFVKKDTTIRSLVTMVKDLLSHRA